MKRALLFYGASLAIVFCIIAIFALRNDMTDSKIYEAYESIQPDQSRMQVERIFSTKAPFSKIEVAGGDEFTLVLYIYEDRWPLNLISIARLIEVRYDSANKVISKRSQVD